MKYNSKLWTLVGLPPFGFPAKASFTAENRLAQIRSTTSHKRKEILQSNNFQKGLPPDFSYKLYTPSPVQRNSRDAIKPWKYTSAMDLKQTNSSSKNDNKTCFPEFFLQSKTREKEKEKKFVTRIRTPSPFTAKLTFVKEGMLQPDPYKMPKPHDFRGYPPISSLGLPEFNTSIDWDLLNLKFKQTHLDTIYGINPMPSMRHGVGKQMGQQKLRKPHWEADLMLHREPWPNRYAAYSRHRRKDRTAYSAFMERVERKLMNEWGKGNFLGGQE